MRPWYWRDYGNNVVCGGMLVPKDWRNHTNTQSNQEA